ncbi:MAG: hypothetical protein AB1428_13115 [Bacteroidota bacterium]
MTRTINRVVLKVVAGVFQPDTGLTVELKTDEATPVLIGTAVESPAGSGQYYISFAHVNKWGYWYVGGTRKTEWGQWWLGEESTPIGATGSANQLIGMNSAADAFEWKSVFGTSNRVSVTHGAGTITLSAPQDIHTGASPTFQNLTLNGNDLLIQPTSGTALATIQAITTQYALAKFRSGAVLYNVGVNDSVFGGDWFVDYNGAGAPQLRITSGGAATLTGKLTVTSTGGSDGLKVNAASGYAQISIDDWAAYVDTAEHGLHFYRAGDKLMLASTGDLTTTGDVIGTTAKAIRNSFTSGQFGSGYRLDHNSSFTGQSFMEIDNLVVRGAMRVNIFEKGVIKAVSGGVYVSSASSTVAFDQAIGGLFMFVAEDNTFAENDILQYKDITITGGLVVVSAFLQALTQAEVDIEFPGQTQFGATGGGYKVYVNTLSGSGTMRTGGTVVQVGNASNTTRQAGLFLTANDGTSNVPYIDVYNGRSSYVTVAPLVRMGALGGITTTIFGTLSGYGLYGENVYLTGNAQISGTLAVGGGSTVGNTFYVGQVQTNLWRPDSETVSTWEKIGTGWTITDNAATSPDGQVTSGTIIAPTTTDWLGYPGDLQNLNGQTVTISFWAKISAANSLRVFAYDTTEHSLGTINLTTSWQRFTLSYTFGAGTNSGFFFRFDSTTATYYIWGVQKNLGGALLYQKKANYAPTGIGYGMWATAGGFGGTMQSPVVALSSIGLNVALSGSYYARIGITPVSFAKGFYIGDGTNHLVQFLDTGVNKIAGWDIGSASLGWSSGTKAMIMYSDDGLTAHNPRLSVAGNTSGATYITLGGSVYDGSWQNDKWGMVIRVNSANLFRCYSAADGTGLVADIAAWDFTSTYVWKKTNPTSGVYYSLALNSTLSAIEMHFSSTDFTTPPASPTWRLRQYHVPSSSEFFGKINPGNLLVGDFPVDSNLYGAMMRPRRVSVERANSENLSDLAQIGIDVANLTGIDSGGQTPYVELTRYVSASPKTWYFALDTSGNLGIYEGTTRRVHLNLGSTAWAAN